MQPYVHRLYRFDSGHAAAGVQAARKRRSHPNIYNKVVCVYKELCMETSDLERGSFVHIKIGFKNTINIFSVDFQSGSSDKFL